MTSLKKGIFKNLQNTYCRLRPSKYGVGVFAVRDIPKKINPFSNCRKARWFKFKEEEISKLSYEVVKIIKNIYGRDEGLTFFTTRKIKKGEELFADYNTYDPLDEILSK